LIATLTLQANHHQRASLSTVLVYVRNVMEQKYHGGDLPRMTTMTGWDEYDDGHHYKHDDGDWPVSSSPSPFSGQTALPQTFHKDFNDNKNMRW